MDATRKTSKVKLPAGRVAIVTLPSGERLELATVPYRGHLALQITGPADLALSFGWTTANGKRLIERQPQVA